MNIVNLGERRLCGGKEHEHRNDDGRHQRRRPDEKDEDDRHRGERAQDGDKRREEGADAPEEPCKESKPHAQNDGYGECEKRPSERIQKRTPKRFLSQRLEERGGGLRKGG